MPRQGQSVEACTIVRWLKQPGENVGSGEVLCEIETDKAAFEVESTASGTLLAQFVPEGEEVPVLTPIAAVGEPGEKSTRTHRYRRPRTGERRRRFRASGQRRGHRHGTQCAASWHTRPRRSARRTCSRPGRRRGPGRCRRRRAAHATWRTGSLSARPQTRRRAGSRLHRRQRQRSPWPHHRTRRGCGGSGAARAYRRRPCRGRSRGRGARGGQRHRRPGDSGRPRRPRSAGRRRGGRTRAGRERPGHRGAQADQRAHAAVAARHRPAHHECQRGRGSAGGVSRAPQEQRRAPATRAGHHQRPDPVRRGAHPAAVPGAQRRWYAATAAATGSNGIGTCAWRSRSIPSAAWWCR